MPDSDAVVYDIIYEAVHKLLRGTASVDQTLVTIQNQSLLDLVYTLKTGADGSVTFFDIPEGRYTYNISASGTTPTSGSAKASMGNRDQREGS